MKLFRKTLNLLLLVSTSAAAQQNINNETFIYYSKQDNNGVTLAYVGKSHSFTFRVAGKKVKIDDKDQHIMYVDGVGMQTLTAPMPPPVLNTMKLSKLNLGQQKNILDSYSNYEIDYTTHYLKVNLTGLKKKWLTINSKLFIVWYFELPVSISKSKTSTMTQLYFATTCFNQICGINAPVLNKNDFNKSFEMAKRIAATLKLYDKQLEIK